MFRALTSNSFYQPTSLHLIPIFIKTLGTGQYMGKMQEGKGWISTTWLAQSSAAIEMRAQEAAEPGSNSAV